MDTRGRAEPDADFLGYEGGVLRMEGTPLPELARSLGTPFFLFSEARLRSNYQALERGLSQAGAGTVLRYCAKTNHEAAVLQTLARCGSHLLASHAAEVELALRCGFAPERIAFARPVLMPAELSSVVAAGVPLVHVHRPDDLPLVEGAAARAGRRVRVSLRLRQEGGLALSPLDRLSRRLGFGREEALEAVRRLGRSSWIEPWAVNFYLGTQQSSLAGFTQGFRRVLALLSRIRTETGVAIREVNLGGGIPSPSLRRMSPGRLLARWRDLPPPTRDTREEFAARLAHRFRELVAEARLPESPALAAEPGRSIVGGAAVLVTRVQAVSGRWAFLDASRSFLPESPLMFARRILPLIETGKPRKDDAERFYHLSGSSLNTLDVLDLRRRLPRLEPGQDLAFCDAGAYSISRASSYAGLPPAVYMLQEDGGVRLVRQAGSVDHLAHPMLLQGEILQGGILQGERVEVLR
ncbi:MAG: diaminopimelate decarboxylase [Acidobacteriota bacterium]|jgi:diaminopimelate decarboxylase|nr:diaminopimelate decarboxylase [Acidobacteriota bacterium]